MPSNYLFTISVLATICCTGKAMANEADEMAELQALLNEETAIATQNKMNAAYVPGMVSVLHGDDLAEQGVNNLAEALNKVAGFHVLHNNNGDMVTLVRGIGSSVNGSNVKLMLDGVAVNRPSDASADWLLRFPVAQIERIEVIRGPGSALYGEFAFSGVVNVITKQTNRASVKTGQDGFWQGDLIWHHDNDAGLQLGLNLSTRHQQASNMLTNPDNFFLDGGYSPAKVHDQEAGTSASLSAALHGYQINVFHANVERGGWYGRNAAMPRAMEPREESSTHVNLDKSWKLSEQLSVALSLTHSEDELLDATFLPIIGGLQRPGARPNEPLTVERFVRDAIEMQSSQARLQIHWQFAPEHRLFAASELSKSKIEDSFRSSRLNNEPLVRGLPSIAPVAANASRLYRSTTLQDEWSVTDDLTLTVGARFDHYDDWGSHSTPRFAAVWQLSESHLFKVQYSEAFRPPTMVEAFAPVGGLTGDSGRKLKEESLNSTEVAYIYRNAGVSVRTTLFKTKVLDLIEYFQRPGASPIWRNQGKIDTSGAEVEFVQKWGRNWSWFSNLSYVDAEDQTDSVDGIATGSIKWLGNAGVSWQSDQFGVHSLSLNYTGSQEGYDLSLRQAVTARFAAVSLLDYSWTLRDFAGFDGLQAQFGLNNLLNKTYNVIPTPLQYPLGLPAPGRRVFAGLNYNF